MDKIELNGDFLKRNDLEKFKEVFIFLEKLRRSGEMNMLDREVIERLEKEFKKISHSDLMLCWKSYILFYSKIYKKGN